MILALIGIALGLGSLFGLVGVSGLPRRTAATIAQRWYALTDWPLFQFLLWRALWRWAIWVRVLIGLSRIQLNIIPSHPDRHGGISFLRLPSIGYCAGLLFAVSSVLCSEWSTKYVFGTTLASFTPLLFLFAVVGMFIALGPLLVFAPQLYRARRRGVIEYSGLAADYARLFRRRWIEEEQRKELLRTNHTQALADLTQVYRETVDRFYPVLFDKRDLLVMLIATLLPLVSVMLAHVPSEEWKQLAQILSGGRLY
jgi:hypothetical protein